MEAGRILRPVPKDNTRVVPPQRGVVYVVERVGRFHRIIDSDTQGPLMPLVERIVCALSSRDESIKIPRTRVLSADRNTLSVGGFATVRVVDPRLAAYSVENVDDTIRLVASAALRAAAATLTKAALNDSPQLLAEAAKTRVHNSVSQWGCKCTAFTTTTVRESGIKPRSRDTRPSNRNPTVPPASQPNTDLQPSKPRQNKFSARRQGSLLAQHLLDDNARLADGAITTGRSAAAVAIAELVAAKTAHKRTTDNTSPGWLVPSPPQSQAATLTPRRESPSPVSALEARTAQARESAAAKRQRAIDNATVAPKRAISPKENKDKATDPIVDRIPPVSRAAIVPESATSKLVRVEPRRQSSSPVPVRTSPPQQVPVPLPSRASRGTAESTIVVLDATKNNDSEEAIVFQVANPSPRLRRSTPPRMTPSPQRSSPIPRLIGGPSPQPQILPVTNSVPKVVPALPAPAQQPNQVVKQVDENRIVPGALASAVSAAMRDITALAAAENKYSILDTSQITTQNNSPPDASNDFTPPPPPSTPANIPRAQHVPANRSRKLSSQSQSRRLSAAANLQIYPASAPASLASSGEEIRAEIELIRRSSAGTIPAPRRAPEDVVIESSSVAMKKPLNLNIPTEESLKAAADKQKENEPELENQQNQPEEIVTRTADGQVDTQIDTGTLETVPPTSLVIHDGQISIPLPLPAPSSIEQVEPSDAEVDPKSEENVQETQTSSNDAPAPAPENSTPPLATRTDPSATLISSPSPNSVDSERLPPPIASVSEVVVAETAPVSLFRRALTPPNTMESGAKGEVGSETSDEPGGPDAESFNEVVSEPAVVEQPTETLVGSVPSPDSSPVTNSSDEQEGAEVHTGESLEQLETTPPKSDVSERASEKSDNDGLPLEDIAQDDLMPVPEQAPRFVPQRNRRPPTRAQKIILDDDDGRHISYVPREYGYEVMEPRRTRRKSEPRTRDHEPRYDGDERGDPDQDMHAQTLESRDESLEETREEKRRRRQERRERKARRERKRQQIAEYHEQLRAAAEAEEEADPDGDLSDGWRDENRRDNRRTRSSRVDVGSDDESDPDMQGSSIERPSRWSPPSAEQEDLYWHGHERDLDRDHRKRSGGSGGTLTRERKRRERDPTPHSRAERPERSRSSSRTRDDRRTSSGRRRYEEEYAAARSSRSRSASVGTSSRRNPESWEAEQIPDPRRTRSRSSSRDVDKKRRSASADTRVTPREKERRTSGERSRASARSRSAMGTRERSPSRRRGAARHRSDMGFGTMITRRSSIMNDGSAVRPIYNHGSYDDSESDSANAKYIPWYCEGQSDVEDDPSEMRCLYISANGRMKCNHPRCVARRRRRRRLLRRGRHVSYHPHLVWASDDAVNGRRY